MSSFAEPQRAARTCACGRPVVAEGKCAECQKKSGVLQLSPVGQSAALPTAPAASGLKGPGRPTPPAGYARSRSLARVPLHPRATDRPRMRVGLPGGADERHATSAAAAFERAAGVARARRTDHALADPSPPMRDIPDSVLHVVCGEPGRPLEPALRAPIESHLGTDLAAARIHTGAAPAASARELGARAYTVGHHVVFGPGQYAPTTRHGRRLLVHELAHVAQQSAGPPTALAQLQMEGEQSAPTGDGTEQAAGGWKASLLNAIGSSLPLPAVGAVLLARFGEGVGKELGKEGPSALGRLAVRAATMTINDHLQVAKGYGIGLVEGIVSPVTDLFGLGVFAEKILNVLADVVGSALGMGGKLAAETEAVQNAAKRLLDNIGKVWEGIKGADLKQLASDVFSGAGSLPAEAGDAAERFGGEAGHAMIAALDSPWEKEQPEEEKSGGGFHPLASIDSWVGGKVKQLVGDIPWAKVGEKVGYAVGFAIIQVIILVFTEGIGNAIEEGAAALGKFASSLGKLGKAVGTAAEFLGKVGKAIGWVEALIGKVMGAALKPLEKVLKPILEPLTDLFGSLKKWLQKLFGVVEEDGPALEAAAAKAVSETEKHVPAPAAPVEKPAPKVTPAEHKVPAEHGGPSATEHKPVPLVEKRPPAEHKPPMEHKPPASDVAKESASGGHTIEVTNEGIELCSPKPCPVIQVAYKDQLARDAAARQEADALDRLRREGKVPKQDIAKRAKALQEHLEWQKTHFGEQEPLVVARVQGADKGQYWHEGSPEFGARAGSKSGPPDPRHVVLPKREADRLGFRPAGTPHDPSIKPYTTPGGTQLESTGAGRRTQHDITARTARKPAPPGVKAGTEMESELTDPSAERGFHNVTQADLNQAAGTKALMSRGERVLLRPGNVSTGGVDAITVRFGKGGEAEIYLNDFTTPNTAKGPKPTHTNWREELNDVVSPKRLNLGDKQLEDAVRRAVKNGNVYVRTVRVEIPASGGAWRVDPEPAVKVK